MYRYLYKYQAIPPLKDFDVGYGFGYYGKGDKLLITGHSRADKPLDKIAPDVLAEWVMKNGFKSPAAARKAGEARKTLFDRSKAIPGWDSLRAWNVLVSVVVIESDGEGLYINYE